MNTKLEIVKILNTYDFIIIPGLGAFQGMYSKPYFNAVGDIVPAQRKLSFEPIIKKDPENKLFELLVERINIPKNLILIEYSDFIDKLNLELNSTGKFDFEGLGSFFKLSDGTISFYADQAEAKKPFVNKPELQAASIIEPRLPEPTTPAIIEKYEPAEVIEESNTDDHNSKEEFIKSMETTKPFKVLLYMVPFFLLLGGLSYAVFFKPNEKKETKPSMMAEIDSLSKLQDELDMEPVYKADPPIQESTYSVDRSAELAAPTPQIDNVPKEENKEVKVRKRGKTIPIGVFSSRETADNVVSRFAENGVPARTKSYKGKYKVFVVSYSDEQTVELQQKIQELNSFVQ